MLSFKKCNKGLDKNVKQDYSKQEAKAFDDQLLNDKVTCKKRKEVKEKLKVLGETDENTDRILNSIECYCRLVLQSLNKSEYG